jgi:hypothetical protein
MSRLNIVAMAVGLLGDTLTRLNRLSEAKVEYQACFSARRDETEA